LESLLESWAIDKFTGSVEDFNEQEYQKIIKKHRKAFIAYRKSLFMPYYEKTYQLNYEAILPSPLERFNHSCYLKQFYFIKTANQLLIATGCACGSGTRYHHGLFGHYFALLAKEGHRIKSFITRINKNCRFQIVKQADCLILYGHDLVGNFRVDP
jgi:hypothetical protein